MFFSGGFAPGFQSEIRVYYAERRLGNQIKRRIAGVKMFAESVSAWLQSTLDIALKLDSFMKILEQETAG